MGEEIAVVEQGCKDKGKEQRKSARSRKDDCKDCRSVNSRDFVSGMDFGNDVSYCPCDVDEDFGHGRRFWNPQDNKDFVTEYDHGDDESGLGCD